MRTIITLAAGALLTTSLAATAQTPPANAPSQAPATGQAAPAAPQKIKSVQIVDFAELPDVAKTQVDAIIKQRNQGDLEKLHAAIEASPEVKSALKAKGATTEQVVAANVDAQGALTLITKKTG